MFRKKKQYVAYIDEEGLTAIQIGAIEANTFDECQRHGILPILLNKRVRLEQV